MAKKISSSSFDFLRKIVKDVKEKAITKKAAQEGAKIAVVTMKDMISKGISPIEGKGRFPEYKYVKEKKAAKAGKGKAPTKSRRYPYSVQSKFPSKKERPVNLYLSGDFMKALKGDAEVARGIATIEIDYEGDGEKIKEKGHRDGAGGQPKRPTIPNAREGFSNVIVNELRVHFRSVVEQYLRKLKK